MIDICVLTAGKFDLLHQCLSAIKEETKNNPANVYVFDNGSPSEELVIFRSLFTQDFITKVKRNNRNTGFPAGANSAIGMGKSELVLFVSDDIVLKPGAIKSLLSTMKDPTIGMCGLKLLFPQLSTDPARPAGKVQHVGHTVDLRGNIIHPFVGWSADNPKTKQSGEMFSVTGAAFMVRRKLFNQVGGFDPVYGKGYFEDVELALRLRGLGYKIWIDTNSMAEHHVGATFAKLGEPSPMEQNRSIFLARNKQFLVWTDWEVR